MCDIFGKRWGIVGWGGGSAKCMLGKILVASQMTTLTAQGHHANPKSKLKQAPKKQKRSPAAGSTSPIAFPAASCSRVPFLFFWRLF